jgi:squalene/oxidosqualene cyclase-like protein
MYESYHSTWLRNKACVEVMEQIKAEDHNTNYICIGPVNKTLNMLCVFYDSGSDSEAFKRHEDRLDDYLWMGVDGMKMQGYNGSQMWDTAFSAQAVIHSGVVSKYQPMMEQLYDFLDVTQVKEEVPNPDRYYRHVSVGAWPFSTRDHGWPISDCTAEGLKTILSLHNLPKDQFSPKRRIADERLFNAANVILTLQNPSSGGWATYENMRTGGWLESINPSETFHGIMVDYPYVECTSACVQALTAFKQNYPEHRTSEIEKAIATGMTYIKSIQRPDGSWKGSWGVCFTYAVWFGVEAMVAVGETLSQSAEMRNACQFLLDKQNEDGGWGESFQSCVEMEWVPHVDGSQVVNTAWALLALQMAKHPNKQAIDRGLDYLRLMQLPNGDWVQEGVSGVFNANCAISYSGYKNIFPIWALGTALRHK